MMHKLARLTGRIRRDDRGGAAVETALAMPVYLFCLFALIEVGRLVYTQGAVMFAAQEATRYATVHYNASMDELKSAASNRIFALEKDRITHITVHSVLDPVDQAKRVTVELGYRHDLLLPLLPGEGVTLEGASRGFWVEK